MDKLEEEHRAIRNLYAQDKDFQHIINLTKPKTKFEDAWKPFNSRFPKLVCFLGGLGTVFPGTSLVEANFSVLKWTKDEFNTSFTDFSLEGVLHAKQFAKISKLN